MGPHEIQRSRFHMLDLIDQAGVLGLVDGFSYKALGEVILELRDRGQRVAEVLNDVGRGEPRESL
jgi:hypothetical protein